MAQTTSRRYHRHWRHSANRRGRQSMKVTTSAIWTRPTCLLKFHAAWTSGFGLWKRIRSRNDEPRATTKPKEKENYMIDIRHDGDRGMTRLDWLDSRHAF